MFVGQLHAMPLDQSIEVATISESDDDCHHHANHPEASENCQNECIRHCNSLNFYVTQSGHSSGTPFYELRDIAQYQVVEGPAFEPQEPPPKFS